ncbi:MAG: hypothetical protein LAN71_15095 [Acidobacteriia bacterium]|nr:hypothetical protein [Terriglobia bacterium]
MTKLSRRDFSRRASLAAAAAPFLLHLPAPPQDAPSHTDELQKRADSQRNQLVSAIRAKPLPLDLEPAFLFAAKPREKKRQPTKKLNGQ